MAARRVAVITGGSSGIGEATARRLAADGCAVAILDVNRAGGEAVAKSLSGRFYACDVADAKAVDAAAAQVEKDLGPADILVTSAGLIPNSEAIMDMDMAAHDRMWQVNYNGTIHAGRAFGRQMIARKRGAIVTLGSINSRLPLPLPAYNPGKAAIERLTQLLAVELGRHGIRVNSVGPTYVMTPPLRAKVDVRPARSGQDHGRARLEPPARARRHRRRPSPTSAPTRPRPSPACCSPSTPAGSPPSATAPTPAACRGRSDNVIPGEGGDPCTSGSPQVCSVPCRLDPRLRGDDVRRGPPMPNDAVTYRSQDRIAVITIDKPERMNRIDADVVEGLHDAWVRFMASDEDRVAVLTGAGDKAFSAGADLKSPPNNLYRGIPGVGVAVDKPVVGAVAGWVVGGGMVLTTMCDILVAADNARFSYPEVKVGFTGGLITNLASRIPHKIAMELLLVGEPIDAKRAYEVGYVNKVVPVAELMPAALDYARRIAATAPMPSRALKRFVAEALPKGPTEIAGIARAQTDAIFASEDWEEGRKAFAEKRPPQYRGR